MTLSFVAPLSYANPPEIFDATLPAFPTTPFGSQCTATLSVDSAQRLFDGPPMAQKSHEPATCQVAIEGSNDGQHWTTVATFSISATIPAGKQWVGATKKWVEQTDPITGIKKQVEVVDPLMHQVACFIVDKRYLRIVPPKLQPWEAAHHAHYNWTLSTVFRSGAA